VKYMKIVDRIKVEIELPGHGYTVLKYELIASEEGERWGLSCSLEATGESAAAEDVRSVRSEAEDIMKRMAAGTVTPVSFYDILYDLLP